MKTTGVSKHRPGTALSATSSPSKAPDTPPAKCLGKRLAGSISRFGGGIAHKARVTAKNVARAVDPTALGGAVAGLTAGGLAGAALGGAIGAAVGGPAGAVMGAEVGALVGTSVGVKLGYDVTFETLHPDKVIANQTAIDRVKGVTRTFVRRAGDSIGSGVGAAGGATVGMVVAGPVGGVVGALVGETLAGDIVENQALKICDTLEKKPGPKKKTTKGKQPKKSAGVGEWLQEVTRDTTMESGSALVLGVVGGAIAGPVGRALGERTGLIAAKRVNWGRVTEEQPDEGPPPAPKKVRPKRAGKAKRDNTLTPGEVIPDPAA